MRRLRRLAFPFLLLALAFPARPDSGVAPQMLEVLGSVTNAARPVANALVIALNLRDLGAIQTFSSADGSFSLSNLPTGIYKIIAVKQGFAPAIATVVPNKSTHRVVLSLEGETAAARRPTSDEMWRIRASLPPDILHQVDMVLEDRGSAPQYNLPRMRGEMVSMTGADQTANGAWAETSVGVESRITDTWQIGIHGNLRRIDDPTDEQRFGTPAAQSSVMSMEIRSSPTDSYRVASTKSFWRYGPTDRQADLRSHDFEWQHGAARVGVHYFAQENLFASNPFGSDLIEVNGNATLLQTRRTDLGVSLRVTQESIRNTTAPPLRSADVSANASLALLPSLLVRYGLSSRMSLDRTELAPRTGFQWKFARDASLFADGMYKVVDPYRGGAILPVNAAALDDGRLLPRYSVSIGVISGDENGSHVSAVASMTAVDAPLRVVFNDGTAQFWDGLYIDSGDVRRDVRVSYRQDIGSRLAIDVSTSAGTATPAHRVGGAKSYVTTDLQSIFFPTGTSLLISFREIRQPQAPGDYRSERVNVRMAQSLHLPLDLKLLLGLEVVRAENSPFLFDVVEDTPNGMSKKYVGGLAVNF